MGTNVSGESSTSILKDEKNQAGNILWEWPTIIPYGKGVRRAQAGQWKMYATERKNNSVQEKRKVTSQLKMKAILWNS
jgi:undecaprenyl pyrophosphate synthase